MSLRERLVAKKQTRTAVFRGQLLDFHSGRFERILLDKEDQELLLRTLLTRQERFTIPTSPPFVVVVRADYEMDREQTTPCRSIPLACSTQAKASLLYAWIRSHIKRFASPSTFTVELASLPEKDFFPDDITPRGGNPLHVHVPRMLAELLQNDEHVEAVGKAYWNSLVADEWQAIYAAHVGVAGIDEKRIVEQYCDSADASPRWASRVLVKQNKYLKAAVAARRKK